VSVTTAPADTVDSEAGAATSRRFLIYLTGRTVGLAGDAVWFLALAWSAAQAGGPATTSLVLAAGTVPRAALILLGGAIADRLGARRVMVRSDAGRAVLMALGAVVVAAIGPSIPLLLTFAVVFGLVDAVYHPAAGMVPRALLHPAELPRGQALAQLGQRGADVIGASLGGVLVAAGGLALACAVNAMTFLAVLGCVLAVRLPRPTGRATRRDAEGSRGVFLELREGLRYAAGNETIRVLLLLVTALNALGAPVTSIGVLLRVEHEGWGVGALAMFEALFAAGAVLGSIGVARRGLVRRPAVVGAWWAVVQAVAIAAVALAPTLPMLVAAGVLVGITAGPASAYLLGEVQARAAERYLGRVMSLVGFSAVGLVPVGYAAFGALAEVIPLRLLGAACALLMLPACALALTTAVLRSSTDSSS
jgi:MFS family permease